MGMLPDGNGALHRGNMLLAYSRQNRFWARRRN